MLLVVHLIFATVSLGAMLAAVAGKLRNRMGDYDWLAKLSGFSFCGLLVSGTALFIQTHQNILGACVSGLLYLGFLACLYAFYRKLAVAK